MIQRQLLTRNMFSRPGKKREAVKGIVIHWVGNAGSGAAANRNYFESLKNQKPENKGARFASAHFIAGLEGEIIQRVPLDEMACHAGAKTYKPEAITAFGHYPNNCTTGIELCHPDESGTFTRLTLDAAAELCAPLCSQLGISRKDIWTRHQITGKICPKGFVGHPEEFDTFEEAALWKSR
ncbi:MAG: peptidoglycan recognition protein family protein [Spirochaetaceae bacterium]|nr:peptidoglycan recognition protein family protein [Spirochaetaceae bacterium]